MSAKKKTAKKKKSRAKKSTTVVVAKKPGAKKKKTSSKTGTIAGATKRAKKATAKTVKKAKGAVEGRGTLLASAVGVAAAAAAGMVAFKTMRGDDRTVFHLMPHKKGWQITKTGRKSPVKVEELKQKARAAARELARKNEPSQLVIHRTDGTIQSVSTYGE